MLDSVFLLKLEVQNHRHMGPDYIETYRKVIQLSNKLDRVAVVVAS